MIFLWILKAIEIKLEFWYSNNTLQLNTGARLQLKTNRFCEKNKPTNVGRIALERQARQFNSGAVASMKFSLKVQKQLTTPRFEPLTSRSLTRSTAHSGPFSYAAIDFILVTSFTSEWDHSKMKNESVKKSLENSECSRRKLQIRSSEKYAEKRPTRLQ